MAVLPSLLSLGRRVEVDQVEVTDLRLLGRAHRRRQAVVRGHSEKLGDQPESPPMTQAEIDRLAGFLPSQAALVDAAVCFYDLSTPYGAAAPIKIEGPVLGCATLACFRRSR